MAAGGTGVKEGCSSIQAIPAGAWKASTWPARSEASMNEVDTDEHWQTIGRRGTPTAWGPGGNLLGPLLVGWTPVLITAFVHPCPVRRP